MDEAGTSTSQSDVLCDFCVLTLFEIVLFRVSEDAAFNFLRKHGVIRDEMKCERCGRSVKVDKGSLMFRCNRLVDRHNKKKKMRCEWKMSARKNTFLNKSHLTLTQCIELVACLLWLKPPRQKFICDNVGLAVGTVVDWYSFCREVFVDHALRSTTKIGGPDCIVEIDEAKFGKRKYNRGRRVEGQWVFGGIQRGSGESFLVPVESRDRKTLISVLKTWVLPGTTIYSDCWKAYDSLADEGFQHLSVNHSLTFVDRDTGCHTNTIERTWREVRSCVPRYGIRKQHFIGYLAEYQFKRKYPELKERLHHFFRAAALLYPPLQ